MLLIDKSDVINWPDIDTSQFLFVYRNLISLVSICQLCHGGALGAAGRGTRLSRLGQTHTDWLEEEGK